MSAYLSSDAVTKHLQKFSTNPLLWTFFCLALFLGAQVLEAGHVHDTAGSHTECIKCQNDSTKASTSAGITIANFSFNTPSIAANAANSTETHFEYAVIRGPPPQLL